MNKGAVGKRKLALDERVRGPVRHLKDLKILSYGLWEITKRL